jgi:hypothetical protein
MKHEPRRQMSAVSSSFVFIIGLSLPFSESAFDMRDALCHGELDSWDTRPGFLAHTSQRTAELKDKILYPELSS